MTAAATAWPPHVNGRTGQKVRRNSSPYEAGEGWFRPLKNVTVVHIMRGAERLAIRSMKGRAPKRRYGELTLQDLNILEFMLFKCLDWKSGRCAPTYEQICEATGHSRGTIADAIRRLSKAKILERLRRFQVVDGEPGKGPQVKQAPNAYRFALPAKLRALLGLGPDGPPPPDDASIAARDGRLSNGEQEAAWTGKSTLESELARLGAAVTQRDFRK